MKLYTVTNNANSCYNGKFNTKEEAQALADKLNDEAIDRGNHQIFYNVELLDFEDDTKKLEQALINYAINEASSEDVAKVLNVDADAIQSALVDFAEEWNEAEEPSDADEVIDKWVEFFMCDDAPTDVELTKHNNGSDYLEWSWRGKYYWVQGEFYVDDSNVLHHTFIAPNGKEFEIVCDYE